MKGVFKEMMDYAGSGTRVTNNRINLLYWSQIQHHKPPDGFEAVRHTSQNLVIEPVSKTAINHISLYRIPAYS